MGTFLNEMNRKWFRKSWSFNNNYHLLKHFAYPKKIVPKSSPNKASLSIMLASLFVSSHIVNYIFKRIFNGVTKSS